MDSQVVHIMTISNSIIGVSLLAMPFCFKQCGIILSVLILIASSILTRLSCHLLLKSAIMARRRTFEVLAFHTFGWFGKFVTEIGLIGFLLGTCIAFFVVMGDVGPTILAKMTGTTATETMRTSILMALALFCVLPLGLLRNIDSLTSVCTATIGFYICLVVKIIAEAFPHLFSGDWIDKVEFWRPAGILQCLPIFSMALFCQTQIFEIYHVLPNASLEKMNNLIRLAVNICSCVYICVGIFGYIAFCNQTFTGNILTSFSSTLISDAIKIGFVLSVAFSFPLVIFPCRASLYSLLYKQTYSLHEGTDKYIPEGRFKAITFIIILIPLVIGIMVPNIELVLGIMGSTIGIMICVIFPATCFICVSTKNTNERILAQVLLCFGILILVLGTYANISAKEEPINILPAPEIIKMEQSIPKVLDIPNTTKAPILLKDTKPQLPETVEKAPDQHKEAKLEDTIRHEPPQPQPPPESDIAIQIDKQPAIQTNKETINELNLKNNIKSDKMMKALETKEKQEPPQPQEASDLKVKKNEEVKGNDNKLLVHQAILPPVEIDKNDRKQLDSPLEQHMAIRHEPPQPVEPVESKMDGRVVEKNAIVEDKASLVNNVEKPKDEIIRAPETKEDDLNSKPLQVGNNEHEPLHRATEIPQKHDSFEKQRVDIEAIKKEDKELLEREKEELTVEEKKNLELLKTLEKQNLEQQRLVEQSKKVLEEIKQRQQAVEEKKHLVQQKLVEEAKKDSEKVQQKQPPNAKEKQEAIEIVNNEKSIGNKISSENVGTNDKLLNKENILPLPLVLSNINNNKDIKQNLKVELPPKMDTPIQEEKDAKAVQPAVKDNIGNLLEVKQDPSNNEEGLPALHREIRSSNNKEICDNEVCSKEHNDAGIKEPVIKMEAKLSIPDVVNIKKDDFNDANVKIDTGAIKPLSRDLKSI